MDIVKHPWGNYCIRWLVLAWSFNFSIVFHSLAYFTARSSIFLVLLLLKCNNVHVRTHINTCTIIGLPSQNLLSSNKLYPNHLWILHYIITQSSHIQLYEDNFAFQLGSLPKCLMGYVFMKIATITRKNLNNLRLIVQLNYKFNQEWI